MTTQKTQNHYNKTYKLIAQTIGLVVCLICLFYIVGVVIPEIQKAKDDSWLIKLALLVLPVIGFILTWYQEKIGAAILMAGGLLLMIYYIIQSDYSMPFLDGLLFIITGVLFLFHLKKRSELKKKN
jgi:hypothetical protein